MKHLRFVLGLMMLLGILALLAGCGERWEAAVRHANAQHAAEQAVQAAYLRTPAGQAEAVCQYRSDALTMARNGRGLDLEGALMASQLKDNCMAIFRLTGKVP